MADDPFTQAYDKIWDLLESQDGFTDLVRLGNRVRLAGSKAGPPKPHPQAADLPEVSIAPAGGQIELFVTSTSSRAVQDYSVVVRTGQGSADAALLPLKWELMKALSKSGDNLGLSFVRKVRVRDVAEADSSSGSLTVSVEMWFANSQLQS